VSAQPKLRLSEAQMIAMEKDRIAAELCRLKTEFLAREEARRCSAA